MTETEEKIVQAAIQTFVRYGAKKTTMGDIAEAAEVSRQTVYAAFHNKDGMIVASIRYISEKNLAAVRERLEICDTLGDKLDAYFAETVVKAFELIQSSSDAEDLVSGHNKAGRKAIQESHANHEALVVEILTPHSFGLQTYGQSISGFAHFIVTVVMGLKYGADSAEDLRTLLNSLKTSVLRVLSDENGTVSKDRDRT